jgi:predicted metal-dependent phosphoesterase TrpH
VTPFEGDGVWLRSALHAHTTNSDGEMAPEMLVRHYEWAGFDVLAITDHWVRTA